jgi:hypothetical protein
MPEIRRPSPRAASCWLVSIALASLTGLTLAACGSSGTNNPASAADTALKFSRCMREHGIKNFPDPQVSGGGVKLAFKANAGEAGAPSPRQMEAAQNACRRIQAAAEPKLTPKERVAREESVRKFAACMQSHGVDVHASATGGGAQIRIGGGPGSRGPNPESPAFKAAQKACQGLLPIKGGGPGPSTQRSGGGPGAGLSVGG